MCVCVSVRWGFLWGLTAFPLSQQKPQRPMSTPPARRQYSNLNHLTKMYSFQPWQPLTVYVCMCLWVRVCWCLVSYPICVFSETNQNKWNQFDGANLISCVFSLFWLDNKNFGTLHPQPKMKSQTVTVNLLLLDENCGKKQNISLFTSC